MEDNKHQSEKKFIEKEDIHVDQMIGYIKCKTTMGRIDSALNK
ncbi:hypothetical protein ABIB30_000839 [Pedobacter sp. UYP1]